MKTYKHLYKQYISMDNVLLSIKTSSERKRSDPYVKDIYENPCMYIEPIIDYAENFHNYKHHPIKIHDGISRKVRTIIVPSYDEQIVHHMIVHTLKPIIMKGMYKHSYASIPKRGIHKAKKRIEKWIHEDPKNVKYCLKMDIKKFFDSIPHDLLKDKLSVIIKDKKFLKILYEVIDATDTGLPLGFFTSVWLANWYLQGLDHYIKEDLGAPHYVRFMDDMVIFGSSKKKLHKYREKISNYLTEELGLTMKDNWQVFRFDYIRKGEHKGRYLDSLGFKFYRDRTTLRRSIALRFTRKALKMFKKGRITIYDIRQIMAYMGWLGHADIYNMYYKRIKPNVNIGYCKKRISDFDRKNNIKNIGGSLNDGFEICGIDVYGETIDC